MYGDSGGVGLGNWISGFFTVFIKQYLCLPNRVTSNKLLTEIHSSQVSHSIWLHALKYQKRFFRSDRERTYSRCASPICFSKCEEIWWGNNYYSFKCIIFLFFCWRYQGLIGRKKTVLPQQLIIQLFQSPTHMLYLAEYLGFTQKFTLQKWNVLGMLFHVAFKCWLLVLTPSKPLQRRKSEAASTPSRTPVHCWETQIPRLWIINVLKLIQDQGMLVTAH